MRIALFRIAGPVLGAALYSLLAHLGPGPAAMAGIALWMAVWWISEAVPLAVTSLLPLVLFPLLGIASTSETATNYGKDIIFLFLGGFLLALGIERSGLHRRAALLIVSHVGSSPGRLLLGTMTATALLSMWINSTACVLVMMPIALGLIDGVEAGRSRDRFAIAMMLGVAYAATIGGMATPVGTPPNLVFVELAKQLFPARPVSFGQWMLFGVPYALVFLAFSWVLLRFMHTRHIPNDPRGTAEVRAELKALGPMTFAEHASAFLFTLAAALWITGDDLRLSPTSVIEGWRTLTGWKGVSDAAVALACALPMFLLPLRPRGTERLLGWEFAQARVPWGVLLLIGGGFGLAYGMERSGLATIIGGSMAGWGTGSPVLQLLLIGILVTLLSELGSNTAVAGLALPLVASAAPAWGMDPYHAMIPATLAASCGFMLPIASPMQAIVFGSGRVPVRTMVITGVWMDLAGVLLIALLFALFGGAVFGS